MNTENTTDNTDTTTTTTTDTTDATITITVAGETCKATIDYDGMISIVGRGRHPTMDQIAAADPHFAARAQQRRDAYLQSLVRAAIQREEEARRDKYRAFAVISEVAPSACGVGMRAHVHWVDSGLPCPRAADEGGDLHGSPRSAFHQAVLEAEDRARRVARHDKIYREGYSILDYRTACKLYGRPDDY